MADDQPPNDVAFDIGEAASRNKVIPPPSRGAPKENPPVYNTPPVEASVPPLANDQPSTTSVKEPASKPDSIRTEFEERFKQIEPVTISATTADAKAATNPLVKLLVGIGTACSIVGLVSIFIVGAIGGLIIITLGILIVVGGVLSPKPQQR